MWQHMFHAECNQKRCANQISRETVRVFLAMLLLLSNKEHYGFWK